MDGENGETKLQDRADDTKSNCVMICEKCSKSIGCCTECPTEDKPSQVSSKSENRVEEAIQVQDDAIQPDGSSLDHKVI